MTPEQRALVDGARSRAELRRDPIVLELCDLADEQAARIASLEASVALLDEQGRKMKQERDDARVAEEAATKSAADLRAELEEERKVNRNWAKACAGLEAELKAATRENIRRSRQ